MKLRPQDLRVGNYVNYENTTHVISELHTEKVIHYWINYGGDGYVTTYDQILSIPINVHEVEKLGFNEDFNRIKGSETYFDDFGFYVENDADTFWLCIYIDEDYGVRIATIEFVHELQNLYFAITKREIKYC